MLPPRSVLLPVLAAVTLAGALLLASSWYLAESAVSLRAKLQRGEHEAGETPFPPSAEFPVPPTDMDLLHLHQGDLLALQGRWAEAEEEYERSVEAGGGLIALRKLAQAKMQRRDNAGVRLMVPRLRQAGMRSEDLLLLESLLALRTGDVQGAATLLQHAPPSPQTHYGLALLAITQGNHPAAKEALAAVIAGWEPVLRSSARTLQGAYDEYTLFPESPEIHLLTLLSRALAEVQECELALPLLRNIVSQQDNYRDAWIVRGYCELTTERNEDALASLERAYALDPEKPEIQYFLGRAHAALSDHENALTFLQYALQNGFAPEAEVRRLIADEALEARNTALTLTQLEALSEGEDAKVALWERFVAAALASNRKEDAYLFAIRATERWPSDPKAFELLSKAAAETGREAEAKAALERARELQPEFKISGEKAHQ